MKTKNATTIAVTLTAAVASLIAMTYRTDETGVRSFDLDWAQGIFYELHTAILGVILFAVVNWALPINWSDFERKDLPANVRAANVIALAIVFWAILTAVGRM